MRGLGKGLVFFFLNRLRLLDWKTVLVCRCQGPTVDTVEYPLSERLLCTSPVHGVGLAASLPAEQLG